MRVKMLVDFAGRKKGEVADIPIGEAKALVAKGYAEFVRESGVNQTATNALQDAKRRDNSN